MKHTLNEWAGAGVALIGVLLIVAGFALQTGLFLVIGRTWI